MDTQRLKHEGWMREAIKLARRGWGDTHPNPMVGAIVVEGDAIVAQGWHAQAGASHAERMALDTLGRPSHEEAVLYVTLEPCSTVGRTPACTDRIITSGIRRVVIGAVDPNPRHAGRGITLLREAGIEVTQGVLADACEDLNLIFNHTITQNTPLFAGKVATTLDGYMATRTRDSKWITTEEARQDVMAWRRYFPAIAVGAGTVAEDNPHLTSRIDGQPAWCPQRLIIDPKQSILPEKVNVFTDDYAKKSILVTAEGGNREALKSIKDRGVQVWELPLTKSGLDMIALRRACNTANIYGVLIEGGAHFLSDLLGARQLDYLFAYRAPKFLADTEGLKLFHGAETSTMASAFTLDKVQHAVFGQDQLMRGFLHYPEQS